MTKSKLKIVEISKTKDLMIQKMIRSIVEGLNRKNKKNKHKIINNLKLYTPTSKI